MLLREPRPNLVEEPSASGELAPVEVAAGLVFRAGKLLISRRRAQDHLGGLWEFPGGKREPGETFAECLRRELREELDVETEVGAELAMVRHAYPTKCVLIRFFRCRLAKGSAETQALGCAALAWVSRAELADYAFPAADARLLEQIRRDAALWQD